MTTRSFPERNEIETQFVVPGVAPRRRIALARRVSPSQNHYAITLIRVSFIFRFTLPLLSSSASPYHVAQTNAALLSPRRRLTRRRARESANFEVPVGF